MHTFVRSFHAKLKHFVSAQIKARRLKTMSEEKQELITKPGPALVEATRVHDAALSDEALSEVNHRQPLLDDLILLLAVCALLLVCLAYYTAKTSG